MVPRRHLAQLCCPGPGDEARLGTGIDPGGNGTNPHRLHFGDFCLHGNGCPNNLQIPGGLAQVASVQVQSGSWTFDFGTGSTGGCSPGNMRGGLHTISHFRVGDIVEGGGTPTANLTVTGAGTLLAEGGNGFIVGMNGASGTATISGTGTELEVPGILSLGFGTNSNGALSVQGGASVLNTYLGIVGSGGTGNLSIIGVGSTYEMLGQLWIANGGTGAIVVSGGGELITRNLVGIGLNLSQDAARATVTVDGPGSRWSFPTGGIFVGDNGGGRLTISNGGACVGEFVEAGRTSTIPGKLLVNGAASHLADTTLRVGTSGDGELAVRNGAHVQLEGEMNVGSNAGSDSSALITGPGSSLSGPTGLRVGGAWWEAATGTGLLTVADGAQLSTAGWTIVGERGTGTLDVMGGASVSTGTWCVVGAYPSSVGVVTLRDANSEWNCGEQVTIGGASWDGATGTGTVTITNGAHMTADINVGWKGTGTLIVENGGTVSGGFQFVATVATDPLGTGTVHVRGAGSVWEHHGQFWIGNYGAASFEVTDGGAVVTDDFVVLGHVGGSATLNISGPGSRWTATSGLLCVSDFSYGRLNITSGGLAQFASAIIGRRAGGDGQVTVSGSASRLIANQSIQVSGSGPATLQVENGGRAIAASIQINLNGTVRGNGVLQANVSNAGHVRPGLSAGELQIEGNYTQQAGGTLHIELGGLTPVTQHDRLAVSNSVSLGGTLDVSFPNGFNPSPGQSFTVLTYGSRTGEFVSVSGADLGGGRTLWLEYGATALTLTVVQVQTLAIEPDSIELYAGFSRIARAIAQVLPSGTADVTGSAVWSIDNPAIATVNNGRISAVSAGSTVVRAAYGGAGAAALVNVLALPATLLPTQLVSVDSGENLSNGHSFAPSISADGRFVAFDSDASNLVVNDTKNHADVFVRDMQSGITTRVNVASDGAQAAGFSFAPSISADGQRVAFSSDASNLVAGDTNSDFDVFVHDQPSGQTTLISMSSTGTLGDGSSAGTSISANGRFVAFASDATNLVPGDTNGMTDVFVRDLQTSQTSRASLQPDGSQWSNHSSSPVLSSNGRFLGYTSFAPLAAYLHDRQAGTTTPVSINLVGQPATGYHLVGSISDDGRLVAFHSSASDLVSNDTNGAYDVFIRDMLAQTTTRVSVAAVGEQLTANSFFPRMTPDAEQVAFYTLADGVVAGLNVNGLRQVYVRNLTTGVNRLVSVNLMDEAGNGNSSQNENPALTPDGRYIAFGTLASNLVPFDTNGVRDILRADMNLLYPGLAGDMNCDGAVSVGDIAGFVLALTDPAAYAATYPDCDIDNADVNGNGSISVSDIGPFVALLTGG